MAACCAMFRARLVLPTDGRAARMVRSDFCQPPVIWSSDGSPESTPSADPRLCLVQSKRLTASLMSPLISVKSDFFIVRATL